MRINLPSSMDQLSPLREWVRRLLASADLSESAVHDVVLSIHEAAVNAMLHGNRLDPTKTVVVVVELLADCVTVEVRDEGCGFDWRTWLSRLRREGVSPDSLHGRGLFVMSRLTDDLAHNVAGNVVRMTKRYDRRGGKE
jgi:serine/threonine-protein kinase RsbW